MTHTSQPIFFNGLLKNTLMVKEFRTVRITSNLVTSCELFLETEKAKRLGLESIKDVIEYYTRKGIEKDLKMR